MNILNIIEKNSLKIDYLNARCKSRNSPIEQFSCLLENGISSSGEQVSHASEDVVEDDKRRKPEIAGNCPPALLANQFKQINSFSAYCESTNTIHKIEESAIGECPVSPNSVGIVDLVLIVGVLRGGQQTQAEKGELLDASNNSVKPEPKQSEIVTIKKYEQKDIRDLYCMDLFARFTDSAALPKYTQNLNVDSTNRLASDKFMSSIPNGPIPQVHIKAHTYTGNAISEIFLRLNIDKDTSIRLKINSISEKIDFKFSSANQDLVDFFSRKIQTLSHESLPNYLSFSTSPSEFSQINPMELTKNSRDSFLDRRNNARRPDRPNPTIACEDPIAMKIIDIVSRVISI